MVFTLCAVVTTIPSRDGSMPARPRKWDRGTGWLARSASTGIPRGSHEAPTKCGSN